MVFYFTLTSNPNIICYMGRDKYENEELIRWGWPEDFWFHVDAHSSAHVYVRLLPPASGKSLSDLSQDVIEECAQLTKANSIEGCKLSNVKIVYTPWANLQKTGGMDVGQVGFHDERQRRYITVAKKDNAVLNRLEKTKVEKDDVNFREEREKRDGEVAKLEKKLKQEAEQAESQRRAADQAARDQKSYASVMGDADKPQIAASEDDFM